ncbi:MAG TPA: LuxR C-terminal-related transcriptional regulator [Polyangiaceae bacterium]|nr:LuxR C-terminal-related transcriptional regulator [Polyangiaceae bacterium]
MALLPPRSIMAEVCGPALERSLQLAGLSLIVCDGTWRVLSVHGSTSVVRAGELVPELAALLSPDRPSGTPNRVLSISGGRTLRAVEIERAPEQRMLIWLRGEDGAAFPTNTSRILSEQYGLGNRAQQLLKLLADGLSNREIAAELGLREATIKTYLHQLYETLGVRSRTAAIAHVRGAVSQIGPAHFL